uniref:UBC core domain-containing protein n=1 Tax=Catagonus wagneri TaxID=51154 RepID=A0A8C3X256_9CETA
PVRPLVHSLQKTLLLELKGPQEEPMEGFQVTLMNEGDCYNLRQPPLGCLMFPIGYPYAWPAFWCLTKRWHPSICETGNVCISILLPPVDDPLCEELPSEPWNPTHNVGTVLLSIISLLNEPNTFSPKNVDTSAMYRKWKEQSRYREYMDIVWNQVLGTKVEVERDNMKVPPHAGQSIRKDKGPRQRGQEDSCFRDEPQEETQMCLYSKDITVCRKSDGIYKKSTRASK